MRIGNDGYILRPLFPFYGRGPAAACSSTEPLKDERLLRILSN